MGWSRPQRGQLLPRNSGVIRGNHWAQRLCEVLPQDGTASWMEQHSHLLKYDAHSRVGLLDIAGRSCFLKLYLAKSASQRLGFRLGYGRGIRSFDAAGELARAGLAVPTPLTCLRVSEGMVLLTEAIAGGSDLRRLWPAQTSAEHRSLLMTGAGAILASLHRAGFAHGDYKWSNLLWDGGKFHLVDLEGVRKVAYVAGMRPPAPHLRDLARFTVDAEELDVNQHCYDSFVAGYCAATGNPRDALSGAVGSAAAPIRQRHLKKYGKAYRPLC